MIRIACYRNHVGLFTVRCSSCGLVDDAIRRSINAQATVELHRGAYHEGADCALYYRFGRPDVVQEEALPWAFLAAIEEGSPPNPPIGSPPAPSR